MRIPTIILAMVLMFWAMPTHAAQATLNESVVVDGNYIRLGDLFGNAGDKADAIVGYAPAPGKQAVFDVNWLFRVARAYGLEWRPLSIHERAVVKRDSQIITRTEIEEQILAALIEQGLGTGYHVEISNRSLRLYVASDVSATVGIEDLIYDKSNRRFTAYVTVPASGPAAQRYRVTGRTNKMIEVPVLVERKRANQVIGPDDIEWITVRLDRVQHNAILDADDLVGMVPRRTLSAGSPVRATDIQRPVMVAKGSVVVLVLSVPNMRLTAKGRALDSGGLGDTVRVSNSQSKNVVDGVVTGTNQVRVSLVNRVAMN